jgi:hypothetical protein
LWVRNSRGTHRPLETASAWAPSTPANVGAALKRREGASPIFDFVCLSSSDAMVLGSRQGVRDGRLAFALPWTETATGSGWSARRLVLASAIGRPPAEASKRPSHASRA